MIFFESNTTMSLDPQTPNRPIRRSSHSPPPIKKHSREVIYYDASDFIKPDPSMTRFETRRYIMDELKQCLTKRLPARMVMEGEYSNDENTSLRSTSSPLDRLRRVSQMMADRNMNGYAGDVSFEILEKYLNNESLDYDLYSMDLVEAVLGFILVDRLPNDCTIYSFWNYSPFDALRNAPPLSDEPEKQDTQDSEEVDIFSNDNVLTIQISFRGLLAILASISFWVAITVYQLEPVRKSYP